MSDFTERKEAITFGDPFFSQVPSPCRRKTAIKPHNCTLATWLIIKYPAFQLLGKNMNTIFHDFNSADFFCFKICYDEWSILKFAMALVQSQLPSCALFLSDFRIIESERNYIINLFFAGEPNT